MATTNAEIMGMLGELAEGMRGVRRELDNSQESRKGIYTQLEKQSQQLLELDFKVGTAAQIASQTREETKALHENLTPLLNLKETLPQMVEGWNDLNKTSKRFIWFLGIGGGAVLAGLFFIGDMVRLWFISWLNIPPGS